MIVALVVVLHAKFSIQCAKIHLPQLQDEARKGISVLLARERTKLRAVPLLGGVLVLDVVHVLQVRDYEPRLHPRHCHVGLVRLLFILILSA